MPDERTYALDANIFIEAKRRYYAFDLCPAFWAALIRYHREGRICSIDKVCDELEAGDDELSAWISSEVPEQFFASTDDASVVSWFGQMAAWVQQQAQFNAEAKAEFAAGADGWLIAFAKAKGMTVVTHEVLAPDARNRVPIPNVCAAFQVPSMDTFAMLKQLGARFT